MIPNDKNNLAIKKIVIKELFGYYNYTIPNNKETDINKILLLYGDNGSGKTTILNIIFYLLSTKENSGYKTLLCNTKFKKFSIIFYNNFEITAFRKKTNIGSFEFYLANNGKKIRSLNFIANAQNIISWPAGSEEDITYKEILSYLSNLKITTVYLSDEREILNSITSSVRNSNPELNRRPSHINDITGIIRGVKIEPAMELLNDWVRRRLILSSRNGEKNSQAIFSDIIKNYIKLSDQEKTLKDKDILNTELDSLETKLPTFVELGLLEPLDTKTIRNSIKNAKTPEQVKFLNTMITPFVESIEAKLGALGQVEATLSLFMKTVNEYFSNKYITYHPAPGFQLFQALKSKIDSLDFNDLSRGEKQLLILFIYTITSSDTATIFIIDEPEISLNIKWQRKLIKTLLEFSRSSNIQFILATHSFELLSAYRNQISKLRNAE